jgi:hypothetical protein
MIGNYLYPPKVNSFMDQQIYVGPDKLFSKFNNPNYNNPNEKIESNIYHAQS